MTTTTTNNTTTIAEIRIGIFLSRISNLDMNPASDFADAKLIRAFGNTEIWKVTMMDGKSFKVKAHMVEMDF